MHVSPLLSKFAQRRKMGKHELILWDPYFCDGAAGKRLRSLGFAGAINENVDFYEALDAVSAGHRDARSREDASTETHLSCASKAPPKAKRETPNGIPRHDVLITNPPFSGDHCKRLVEFLVAERPESNPFAILAPAYVHRKRWFAPLARKYPEMVFVVPKTRYAFVAASGGRGANASVTNCRHFARDGRCPRGDRCPFAHADVDARDGIGVEGVDSVASADIEKRGDASRGNRKPTRRKSERVSPFDVVWHVHCGGDAQSVTAAWRQKFSGKREGGPGTGAVLCASSTDMEAVLGTRVE